jgi:DnaJ family protein A protein 5
MDNINIEDIIKDDVNLYEVLNINIDASDIEIKKQYKKLILKYHPDKNHSVTNNDTDTITNTDIYELITLAYNVLSNKELKKLYNELRLIKWDFTKLKTESQIAKPNYEKKNFNHLNEEYNKLHGHDSNEKILNIKEFNTKLEELIKERKKEIIKLKKINKKEFKKEFEKIKRSEDDIDICNDLIPYNLELVTLNSIDNISKLYDTSKSEINARFLLNNLPKYKENNLSYDDQVKNYKNNI